MQKQIKYLLRLIAIIFLFWIVCSSTHAATYGWPGIAPPCNSTLQDCIDNVGSGDTVEIAANTVDESLTIDKSLTLRPALGYSPRFVNVNTIYAGSTGATDNAITIEGLTIEWGDITISHNSTGTFILNLVDNTIEKSFTYGEAIRFWPINGGMTYFNISSNHITVPAGSQVHGIQLHIDTNIEGNINNNSIVMEGATQGSAIEVVNLGAASAAVEIIGNTISGTNMNNGIMIYQYTSGCNTNTTIANNIIANNTSRGLHIDSDVASVVSNNHNLVYNNGSNDFTAGTGTLYVNPSFVGVGDYSLQPGSAAINNGDNASVPSGVTTDLSGKPRIFRSVVDIGAYERGGCITPVLPLLLF